MGVKHFCIGWDVRILADWWDTKGAEMRKLLRTKPKKAAAKPAPAAAAQRTQEQGQWCAASERAATTPEAQQR